MKRVLHELTAFDFRHPPKYVEKKERRLLQRSTAPRYRGPRGPHPAQQGVRGDELGEGEARPSEARPQRVLPRERERTPRPPNAGSERQRAGTNNFLKQQNSKNT